MKHSTLILLVTFLTLCITVPAFSREQEEEIPPDTKITRHVVVRIHYVGKVMPETVTVAPGTTVIWLNDGKGAMEILFKGKQVMVACKNPVHFVLDESGSFRSDLIPQGAVASLCFIEPGEYTYVARRVYRSSADLKEFQRSPLQKTFQGKVIVRVPKKK